MHTRLTTPPYSVSDVVEGSVPNGARSRFRGTLVNMPMMLFRSLTSRRLLSPQASAPSKPVVFRTALVPALLAGVVAILGGCPGAGGQCAINDDCAAGELCLESVCSATCEADSDCGSGETCSNGVCETGDRQPEGNPGAEPNPEPAPNEPDAPIEPDVPPDGGDPEPGVETDGGGPDTPEPDAPDSGTPEPGVGPGDDGGPGGEDGGPDGGGPVEPGDGGPGDGDGGPGPGPDGGPGPIDGGPGPNDGGVDAGPPAPAAPVVTGVTAYSTRPTNTVVDQYVFDIVGTDVNSDPTSITISVFNAANVPLVTDALLNANNFDIDGTDFSVRISVSGFAGLQNGPGTRAELLVRDATGLAQATGFSVALPGVPTVGGACPIPAENEPFVPCPLLNACVGTDTVGTCGTAATGNPTLNPVPDLVRVVDDANCDEPEFPDSVAFTLTGTSEQRIVSITLDGNPLTLNNPSFPPNFNITGSVCARADGAGAVSFIVFDEMGRASNSATGNIPPR